MYDTIVSVRSKRNGGMGGMKYLKFERIARELTQAEVAKATDIPRAEYTKIENGIMIPWKPQAERIENFFKIRIDVLLDDMKYPPALEKGKILELSPGRHEKEIKLLENGGKKDGE